jgi:hypothetical protein
MDFPSIVKELVHVQRPAGTTTVSPSLAELTADATWSLLQLAAVIVAASTLIAPPSANNIDNARNFADFMKLDLARLNTRKNGS